MISVTSAQLDLWLAALFFPLARIGGLMLTVPVFSNAAVPTRIRLIVALALAFAVAPLLPPLPQTPAGSWLSLGIVLQQFAIGAAMGLVVRIAFASVDVAGELIGLQMGLSFAVSYDPQAGGQTPVLAEFMGLITTLMFLALNGHLMVVTALAESFRLLPIALEPAFSANLAALLRWSGAIFATGLLLSLPLIAALLIANIALGVLSRIAPQLNLFAVGFPVTLALGFVVLMLSLPYFGSALQHVFEQTFTALEQVLTAR